MAVDLFDRVCGSWRLRVVVTERGDGDVHPIRVAPDELTARQAAITGNTWAMLHQVHGRGIHVVGPDDVWPVAGTGDVIVANHDEPGPIAVWAADCAPIVLFGQSGRVVAVHAGWRGLAGGVIEAACTVLSAADDPVIAAVVGPLIHPCCYAFGTDDIAAVARGVHVEADAISRFRSDGSSALDVPTSVRLALASHGISADVIGECTGCSDRWYSHRVRGDVERHAVVAWSEPA